MAGCHFFYRINSGSVIFRKQNIHQKSENCSLGLIETILWQQSYM